MPVSFLLNLFRSHGKAWKKFGWKFLFEVICTNFVNFKNFLQTPTFSVQSYWTIAAKECFICPKSGKNQCKLRQKMTYRLLHTDFKWKVFSTRNWRKGVQNGRSIDPSFSGNMLIMFSLFFAISEINMINQVLYLFFLIFWCRSSAAKSGQKTAWTSLNLFSLNSFI